MAKNVCKGCGYMFDPRTAEYPGYCTYGCLRRQARRMGWKDDGISAESFVKGKRLPRPMKEEE
jgi:hypothetical protein